MTITEAIKEAMLFRGRPLSPKEAYDTIAELGLYEFNAQSPLHIVTGSIRRHCLGLDFPSASPTKHFELKEDGKFYFLSAPQKSVKKGKKESELSSLVRQLKSLHNQYNLAARENIIRSLKALSPRDFEHFSRKLLTAYGFVDVKVTQAGRDGGIDGHGKLKVGLAFMNVAFQCKRFTDTAVGRPKIDEFRGAIQGEFEQGIFFTTSTFVKGASEASFKRGAVPVILIDGKGIVTLMLEKQFGVQIEEIPVYSYAIDLVLNDDDDEASVFVSKR